jgi:hypothetical protein
MEMQKVTRRRLRRRFEGDSDANQTVPDGDPEGDSKEKPTADDGDPERS